MEFIFSTLFSMCSKLNLWTPKSMDKEETNKSMLTVVVYIQSLPLHTGSI